MQKVEPLMRVKPTESCWTELTRNHTTITLTHSTLANLSFLGSSESFLDNLLTDESFLQEEKSLGTNKLSATREFLIY